MQYADAFLTKDHWYDDGAQGGGVVLSTAVHRIDLARYLLGSVACVQAYCRADNPRFINGAFDACQVTMEMTSGAWVSVFASWSATRIPYGEGMMLFGESGAVHALPSEPA